LYLVIEEKGYKAMDQVEIMLREYETLRQEVLTSMSNRNSILSFGPGTIGAILTASIAVELVKEISEISGLMLILAVPIISIFVVFIWLGEYERMQRAGKFLGELDKGLESRINDMVGGEPLTWETRLRLRQRPLHMLYPYFFTVLLLTAIGLISLYIGYSVANSLVPLVGQFIAGAEIATFIFAIFRILKLRK
jgi:hypothetical protein